MSKRVRHLHKYEKTKIGETIRYRCVHHSCHHVTFPQLLPGKEAECFRCGNPFVITKEMVRKGKEMKKLHCVKCTKEPNNPALRKEKKSATVDISSLMQKFGINIED